MNKERYAVKSGRGYADSDSLPGHVSQNTTVSVPESAAKESNRARMVGGRACPGKDFIAQLETYQAVCINSLYFVFKLRKLFSL